VKLHYGKDDVVGTTAAVGGCRNRAYMRMCTRVELDNIIVRQGYIYKVEGTAE
jgi:hypothetical protein